MSTPYNASGDLPNGNASQEYHENGFAMSGSSNHSIASPVSQDQPYIPATQLEPEQIFNANHYTFTYIRERHWIEQTTVLNENRVDEHGRETWSARPIATKWIENINPIASRTQAQMPPLLAASASMVYPGSPSTGNRPAMQSPVVADRNFNLSPAGLVNHNLAVDVNNQEAENIASVEEMAQQENLFPYPFSPEYAGYINPTEIA